MTGEWGRLAAAVAMVAALVAGCGSDGAGKQPVPSTGSAVKAAAGADAMAGPGTDCGPAGPVGAAEGKVADLVVVTGHIRCGDALAVLRKYMSGSVRKEGSGGFATFDRWNCSHGSVADIQRDGIVTGCERSDKSVAFHTKLADGANPSASPSSGVGPSGGAGADCGYFADGKVVLRVSGGRTSCVDALRVAVQYIDLGGGDGWACLKDAAALVTCTKADQAVRLVPGTSTMGLWSETGIGTDCSGGTTTGKAPSSRIRVSGSTPCTTAVQLIRTYLRGASSTGLKDATVNGWLCSINPLTEGFACINGDESVLLVKNVPPN